MLGPLAESCHIESDWIANTLAAGLIVGLVLSYVPQHIRIIHAGTSVGFSPWFLLLGSTSSAAAVLNLITLQWPVLRCCADVGVGKCMEISSGMLQVAVQWLLFTIILVLFMKYYPPDLKYDHRALTAPEFEADVDSPLVAKPRSYSKEWRLSIFVSWVVVLHLAISILITFFLLATTPSSPVPAPAIERWATFLGVTSGLLAAVQYAPQILRTYRLRVVGALSIPMMIIQSPGGVVMAVSIAMRPGTDWTSWLMYAVSAVMQAILLIMCFTWKARQHRLRIDDFGRPLGGLLSTPSDVEDAWVQRENEAVPEDTIEGATPPCENTPLLKSA